MESRAAIFKLVLTALVFALSQSGQQSASPTGYSTDWTSQHLIFSNPGSIFEASRRGTLDRWLTIVRDPHYRMQLMRRAARPMARPGRGHVPEQPAGNDLNKDWSVQLASASAGVLPNAFPAKFTFSATAAPSCTADFVVYPAGIAGSASAASIVAYNNLYSGCSSGTVPSVLWAYNTGGTVTTSPIISYDSTGSQIAFIQNSSTSLVLLKWAASGGTTSSPASITSVTPANYRNCTAPCYVTIPLSGSPTVTHSSPFPDYANDIVYVADNSGKVHQITGVFNGTPAENTTGWPVTTLNGAFLFGNVYDPVSGNVFVETSATMYSVGTGFQGTTAGQVTQAGSIGFSLNDSPLVDSSAGKIYVFPSSGSANTVSGKVTVVQFPVTFTSGGFGSGTSSPNLGSAGAGHSYAGTFDNVYYSSANQTGNLYVLGNFVSAGATLYRIPVTAGSMGTPVAFSGLIGLNESAHRGIGNQNGFSGPLVEFCNGAGAACAVSGGTTTTGTDYLFFSGAPGAGSGCTLNASDGCVMSLNISNPSSVSVAGSGLNFADGSASFCFATSGIIVDNSATSGTLAGASQLYFINLNGDDSTGCANGSNRALYAVQASQSAP